MGRKVENINIETLIKCREQMGVSIKEAQKEVPSISKIEAGDKQPTFKQLNKLASLYGVPRWVFISASLPEQYQLNKSPAFRQFIDSNSKAFDSSKVRRLVATVEKLRELTIELREEMGEPVDHFIPPNLPSNLSIPDTATSIRDWLGVKEDGHFDFKGWKSKLEKKGIFIFLSDKYKGWAHVDKSIFRGLSLWHPTLPVIIINDSDYQKAQSFTLFHELGHLLREESSIDDWKESDIDEEQWCDNLAGNVLMPANLFPGRTGEVKDIDDVKDIAKEFKVSPFACAVRLRQLDTVNPETYRKFLKILKEEYRETQNKLKKKQGGTRRDRAKEVFNQYGSIYTRAVFQAYNNKELGLHKLCKLFDLRRASQALSIGKYL